MHAPTTRQSVTDEHKTKVYTTSNGDKVILLGASALVSSKSEPDTMWMLEFGRCSCPGQTYHQHCHHVDSLREAQEMDRAQAAPVECPDRCGCGNPWTVKIQNRPFCGICAPRSADTTVIKGQVVPRGFLR